MSLCMLSDGARACGYIGSLTLAAIGGAAPPVANVGNTYWSGRGEVECPRSETLLFPAGQEVG